MKKKKGWIQLTVFIFILAWIFSGWPNIGKFPPQIKKAQAAWGVPKIGGLVTAASGNITLTEPAGIAQGDLMVATIAYRSNAAFTLPASWALVATQQSSGNTVATNGIGSGVMAYIVRGASAPALTFTRTGGDVALGRITAYSGGSATPYDTGSSNTLASATNTPTTATITTAEAGELLVAMVSIGDNFTTSAFDAATDPTTASGATNTSSAPTAGTWIERADGGTNTGADNALAIADAIKSSAGATGTIQSTTSSTARSVMIVGAFKLAPDTTAPTPDPMTFASTPSNDSTSQISMTATTATDAATPPVNYLFTNDNTSCGSNAGTGGTSSSWQSGTTYSDSGLQVNKCYGYTVTARDAKSPTPNTGIASSASITYTSANTPGTPTLDGATGTTLNLTNAENSNPASNPTTLFAVQVVTTSPSDLAWLNKWVDGSGNASATAVWLSDTALDALVLAGLQEGTTYGVKVKAKNNDGDETSLSAEGQGSTTLAGTLSVDIVDGSGNSVGSPSFAMESKSFSWSYQTSTGTFGAASQKIRVDNRTANQLWTLSIAGDPGPTTFWDGTTDYDFNDATANAGDGGDADSLGGRMTINASGATLTPEGGCSNTGLTLANGSFSEGVTNSITLLSSDGSAGTSCYWDLTNVAVSQTIPREQAAGSYSINLVLSVVAN